MGAKRGKAERIWDQAIFHSIPSSVPYCMNLGKLLNLSPSDIKEEDPERRQSPNIPIVNRIHFSEVFFFPSSYFF